MRRCGWCGVSIEGKRANAIYCTRSCKYMASRKRNRVLLPPLMRNSCRWVAWKPVKRAGGWAKMPIRPDGQPASTTNRATWSSYDAISQQRRKGWVLGEGIGCIDLDDCLHGGILEEWARVYIDDVKDVAILIEVSPSGSGVHVFLPIPPGKGRVIRDGRNIEIYPPDSGRYICITGKSLTL